MQGEENRASKRRYTALLLGLLATLLLVCIFVFQLRWKVPFPIVLFVGCFTVLYGALWLCCALRKKEMRGKWIAIVLLCSLPLCALANIGIYLPYAPVQEINTASGEVESVFQTIITGERFSNSPALHDFIGREVATWHHGESISAFFANSFFKDKYIVSDERAYTYNSFVRTILSHRPDYSWETDVLDPAAEEMDRVLRLAADEPQVVHLYDYNRLQRDAYLYTGEAWRDDDIIYILEKNNGDICCIPISLLRDANLSTATPDSPYGDKEGLGKFTAYRIFVENLKTDAFTAKLSLEQGDNQQRTVSLHFVFLCALILMGLLILLPHAQALPFGLCSALSFPVGAVFYMLFIYLIGLVKIPLGFFTCMALPVIVLSLALLIRKLKAQAIGSKFIHFQAVFSPQNGIVMIVVLFIFFLISAFPQYVLSADSYVNAGLGYTMQRTGDFTETMYYFTAFSIIGPIFHMGARFFGLDFSYTYVWAISTTGIVAMLLLMRAILDRSSLPRWKLWTISAFSLLPVVSDPMNILSMGWLLNNLPIGIMMGLTATILMVYFETQNRFFMWLSLPFFILFAIVRIEGPIFALLFLIAVNKSFPNRRDYSGYTFIFAAATVLQYLFNLLYIGNDNRDGRFWSPLKGGLMIGAVIVYVLYVCLCNRYVYDGSKKRETRTKWLQWLDDHLLVVALAGLACLNIVFFILETDRVMENVKWFVWHLFLGGSHGFTWMLLLAWAPLVFTVADEARRKVLRSLFLFLPSFGLAILTLMAVRINPIRAGAGDSTNRMLLHVEYIFPVIFGMTVASMFSQKKQVEPPGGKA